MATRVYSTAKTCTKCGETLPPSEFRLDGQKADGLYSSCRQCCRSREAERYASDDKWRMRVRAQRYLNPESVNAAEHRYRRNNPERLKERKKQYYDRCRERPEIIAKEKAYRDAHTVEVKARKERWIALNPERHKANSMNSVHRRRSLTKNGVSTSGLQAWLSAIPKVCYWCNVKCAHDYHVDHYVPLSKGGPHEIANLVIACPTCNRKKGARDPLEFANSKGRLL